MALALEVTKPLAVVSSFSAFRSWALVRGVALGLLAGVAVAYSLTAELTLIATSRGDLVAERGAAAKDAKSAEGTRGRVEAELTTIGITRPSTEIKAELAPILADRRLNNCEGQLVSARLREICSEQVAPLKAELARAERREQLEASLKDLQTNGTSSAADKPADPGAHALSIYLAVIGLTIPSTVLSQWLVLVPVLALEVGSALAGVLVRTVSDQVAVSKPASDGQPEIGQVEAASDQASVARSVSIVDTDKRAITTSELSKARPARTGRKARLGHVVVADRATAAGRIVDKLRDQGGRLETASVRGIAALIGARKSTVHTAVAGLVAAGVIARDAGELVLLST